MKNYNTLHIQCWQCNFLLYIWLGFFSRNGKNVMDTTEKIPLGTEMFTLTPKSRISQKLLPIGVSSLFYSLLRDHFPNVFVIQKPKLYSSLDSLICLQWLLCIIVLSVYKKGEMGHQISSCKYMNLNNQIIYKSCFRGVLITIYFTGFLCFSSDWCKLFIYSYRYWLTHIQMLSHIYSERKVFLVFFSFQNVHNLWKD